VVVFGAGPSRRGAYGVAGLDEGAVGLGLAGAADATPFLTQEDVHLSAPVCLPGCGSHAGAVYGTGALSPNQLGPVKRAVDGIFLLKAL
jgi:hypothetical protein